MAHGVSDLVWHGTERARIKQKFSKAFSTTLDKIGSKMEAKSLKMEIPGGFEALGEPPGAKMLQGADWDVLGAPFGGLLEHILAPRWAKLGPRWR